MLLLFSIVVLPFVIFVGGAYAFNYPVTLGVLYGFNVAVMCLVLWAAANQVCKVYTQKIETKGDMLVLSRHQMHMSVPLLRVSQLEIPLAGIRSINLQLTRIGYLLTVKFLEDGKLLGTDLDINPLRPENRDVLTGLINSLPETEVGEGTNDVLHDWEKRKLSWKGNYVFSTFVFLLALVILAAVSFYLGMKQY